MYEVSNISTINSLLYRPLRNEYPQDIFPPSNCRISDLGRGDTFYSVQQIATLINSYYKQSEKIAKLLHNKDLHRLCVRIYEFIYHHFQYKADDQLQQLRSPACSWAIRKKGVDCKSYSIFASCILLNAGVSHYMRRIVQKSQPNGYSHVYVVVPINQKTNRLEDGYYTIDGTISSLQELPYLKADDVFLSAKPQGLSCVFLGNPQENAKPQRPSDMVGDLIQHSYFQAHYNMQVGAFTEKQKTLQTVQLVGNALASVGQAVDLFLPGVGTIIAMAIQGVTALVMLAIQFWYDPCGGTFYTADYINQHLEKEFQPRFIAYLRRVEERFKSNTSILSVEDLNFLLREVDLGYAHYMNELRLYKDDPCSGNTLKGYVDFVQNLKSLVDNMLFAIEKSLKDKYRVSIVENRAWSQQRQWYFIVPSGKNPIEATYRTLEVEDLKERRGIYPYGTKESFEKWVSDNAYILSAQYGSRIGKNYLNEMRPFGTRIREIRENIYLPITVQLVQEKELHQQQEAIYLKYDTQYAQQIVNQTKAEAQQYAQKQVEFWKNLQHVYKTNLKDEKRRLSNVKTIAQDNANRLVGLENKKMLNILLMGLIGLGIIQYVKE